MSAILLVLAGLALLIFGGEALVRGAVSAARAFRVSPMVIGLTLVGFGTSAPELVTSLHAALSGAPGIAIGNVVGSNVANILLILGLAALIAPIAVDPAAFRRDGTVMALVTLAGIAILFTGEVGRLWGLVLVAALAAYLVYTFRSERQPEPTPAREVYEAEAEAVPGPDLSLGLALAVALGGLVATIFGARFLVEGAVAIAREAGLSETVIGLTIVAVGTSMPELVTSVIAVRRGEGEVALGNILGSNIFNLLGILGVTALVTPIAVPGEVLALDVWVMAAATLLLIVFARTGWRIGRAEGAAMLAGYGGYLAWLMA